MALYYGQVCNLKHGYENVHQQVSAENLVYGVERIVHRAAGV